MSDRLKELKFLTIAEVAELTRVSNVTVYRWVHNGQLNAVRFGRSYRIPYAAVEKAMRDGIAAAEHAEANDTPPNNVQKIHREEIA